MSADRDALAARQAALLNALQGRADPPAGFSADDAAAAGDSLRRKRARAVTAAWPALAYSLGSEFEQSFSRFARRVGPPTVGEGLADGFAFASTLDPSGLTQEARTEVLLARVHFRLRAGTAAPRRGPFLAARRLRDPTRVLLVWRIPGTGGGHEVLGPRH